MDRTHPSRSHVMRCVSKQVKHQFIQRIVTNASDALCTLVYTLRKEMFLVIVQKQQQYVMGHASFWAVSSKTAVTKSICQFLDFGVI